MDYDVFIKILLLKISGTFPILTKIPAGRSGFLPRG
jgi:hypothetical protein